jgi:hypothetical protein
VPNVVHTPLIPAPGRAFGTYSIVKQRQLADWASSIALIFSAPGPPSSLLSLSKTEGAGAPGGATIVRLMPRSFSRTRAPHGAPSRASSLQRRAALCGSRPFFPRRLRAFGEGAGGRFRPPNGHAPGGQLVLAAGRSPGAARVREVAFPPGRGRRIRSHPHDAS